MSILLNIDTAQEHAFVSFVEDGNVIHQFENTVQKDHAIFLHSAIKKMSDELSINLNHLDAVAITKGPGSYTGLRVGMSSAKGLCYALNKPLITIGTLELMALDIKINVPSDIFLICPMIDARRMEVYTSLYDFNMIEINAPHATIIKEDFLMKELKSKVIFVGSGTDKFKSICSNENAEFHSQFDLIKSMAYLSNIKLKSSQFDDLALCEPLYVKEHQTLQQKVLR